MTDAQKAMSDKTVLQIKGLCVALAGRGGKQLLRDVDIEVKAGEITCVVGESGSGKSLTAYSVMGLLDPESLRCTAGEILLEGENVLTATPRRLRELRATRMSLIFQEPMTALNPVERIGAQIEEVLEIHCSDDSRTRRRRILEMLEAVHLPDPQRIFDSYPHQLSGGQRQRVVICMALILNPKLLIADEPTTALDVSTQKQILALIRELQQKFNTAVLFITHDFGVVVDVADKVVVMNQGEVVEIGSRDEILRTPRNDYTRMLVSSVPSLVPQSREAVTGDVVLSIKGLSKIFVRRRILRPSTVVEAAVDCDLTLHRREILGIVGQSGSGKSTLARCVIGLETPSAGRIVLAGEELVNARGNAFRERFRRIQMVFQDPYRSLNPRVRVGESIIEGPTNFGVPRAVAMERAKSLMELVDLPVSALDRFPHQFSGGQRQRISIARALIMEPEVLVADEAVSALDVSVQARILKLLESIREKTDVGLLFITHDLRVAAEICDRVIVMNKGRIVEHGSAEAVLIHPRDAYTRALIDAAPGRHWDFRNFRPL
jgi:peptide/nickel transport system ATP-binding protein